MGIIACALVAAIACRAQPETEPPIVVEPGQEIAVERPEVTRPATPADEVVIIERESTVGDAAARPDPDPPAGAVADTWADAPRPTVDPDSAPSRSAVTVLPAGTLLQLELRTPLHTATSLRGDRVAARLIRPVKLAGQVVLPAGTLVEGKVVEVVSTEAAEGGAQQPDSLARIDLAFRWISLPSGPRLALEAGLTAPAGRAVERSRVSPAVGSAGGAAAGAVLGGVLGGRGAAGVGAVLGSLAGMAIVAATKDREVIVPSGTPLDLVLVAPLEVPKESVQT